MVGDPDGDSVGVDIDGSNVGSIVGGNVNSHRSPKNPPLHSHLKSSELPSTVEFVSEHFAPFRHGDDTQRAIVGTIVG